MTLEDILQIEGHAEDGFLGVLDGALPMNRDGTKNIYRSRTSRLSNTPSIEVKFVSGEISKDHEHVFANPTNVAYDTYSGELTVKVTTNRETEKGLPTHAQILGRVRARLQRCKIMADWSNPVLLVVDIRELGTLDTEEGEDSIDISTLSFFCLVQIKPSVWPDVP